MPPTFPSEFDVLTFEHEERISRDGKTRHERYVVSPEGDVYDCEEKMLICVVEGTFRIIGITENFGTGNRRGFYLTGSVDKVIDEHKVAREKIVHHYDKDGKWQWEVKMRDNRAFEFWRSENGRVEESADLELAQKLAGQATIEDVE